MCQLAEVSRAGFYRTLQEQRPVEEEMAVRSAIQQIALEHRRRYGYRRISAELRRRGMRVNHKRVARIMREDNLLAMQPKAFVVTTDSSHELEVYLNLASRMKLTGDRSALGSRHHLHSAASGVRLSGGDPGCLLSQGGGLGAGSNAGQPLSDCGAGAGNHETTTAAGRGSSLRSRSAVRLRGIHSHSGEAADDSEHESAGEPV